MRVVADENMPLVADCLAGHEVRLLPGRRITRADLLDADALLVRSVTRVGPDLVAGTPVRFVGSATIGTDHLDLAGLAALGVAVAAAPGCNARAVGEYVATVLARLAAEQGWAPADRTLGVVGLGNTGGAVVDLARRLGFRLLGCDPFVARADLEQVTLDELLGRADIVSLHVPLTRGGPHPTHHLLDAAALARLPDPAILVNACRGEVVDGTALAAALAARPALTAVLDVWEGEPRVAPALLARVHVGTPHVAGYSQEGKWRGTAMACAALCARLGAPPPPPLAALLATVPAPAPLVPPPGPPAARLAALLQQACPVARDDTALRASVRAPDPGAAFDALRRDYPPRREFTAHRVVLAADDPLAPLLQALGFGRVTA
ncbi:MAG TPA: 4-phosphoerythronate dehydrogenase [Moraxellaceae bacterium]|nr:4-phosphoerythronate dehydrogenase [Moraxellaceae bacterium]